MVKVWCEDHLCFETWQINWILCCQLAIRLFSYEAWATILHLTTSDVIKREKFDRYLEGIVVTTTIVQMSCRFTDISQAAILVDAASPVAQVFVVCRGRRT